MDWAQLRSFYYIATLGSISRAAFAVYRTQSALSQQLKTLESHMGCPLFERQGKQKLILTEEGRQLFRFAEDVFLRHRELMESLDDMRQKRKGYLRLAAGTATLSLMLPDVLTLFTAAHPDVAVTLYDKSPEQALTMLLQGKVDLAVALASRVPGNVQPHPWLHGHFSLMLPKGHPLNCVERVTLRDIADYPVIKLASNTKFASADLLERAMYEEGVPMRVFMEAGNIYLMAEYVRLGFGVSMVVVPDGGFKLFPGELDFVPLAHLFPPETIVLCSRKDVEPTPLVHAFLDCADQIAQQRQSLGTL